MERKISILKNYALVRKSIIRPFHNWSQLEISLPFPIPWAAYGRYWIYLKLFQGNQHVAESMAMYSHNTVSSNQFSKIFWFGNARPSDLEINYSEWCSVIGKFVSDWLLNISATAWFCRLGSRQWILKKPCTPCLETPKKECKLYVLGNVWFT
jgi:hypothetical protein